MDLTTKPWWDYIEIDLQELLLQSYDLLRISQSFDGYRDYSYIVFPASKAYEGILKKVFLDMGLITNEDYIGTRFRIGKSLNPSLDKRNRRTGWVYGSLSEFCGGRKLPDLLWETWKECRNVIFHWFPRDLRLVTRAESQEKLDQIVWSIDELFKECKINFK